MPAIRCESCGYPFPEDRIPHQCDQCGGFYDFDSEPVYHDEEIQNSLPGIWKYQHSFSLANHAPVCFLGEGDTPLVWNSDRQIGFKLESMNPTGSYKDRGTAVLVSQLTSRGVTRAVEDSSGNAGASFAAYCARAGIKGRVFVPETASGPKRRQIEQYGAELVSVPGPRSEAARAVLEAVKDGQTYASHAFLPFGIPGVATIAYELFEQTNGQIGTVISPAGHGALILGVIRGFKALVYAGKMTRLPYFVGVQARNCSPMNAAFQYGMEKMQDTPEGQTIAEGVRVQKPVRVRAILKELSGGKGEIVAIPEEEILPGCTQLAHLGIYAEPTSALVWAALSHVKKEIPRPIILIISGNGLKYYPT